MVVLVGPRTWRSSFGSLPPVYSAPGVPDTGARYRTGRFGSRLSPEAGFEGLSASGWPASVGHMIETSSGLKYEDTQVGNGPTPTSGQTCVMHYTGWLWENGAKGDKFDSSVDRGRPFSFQIGVGQVIGGWDEGVLSMAVGGKRTLLIPPQLGYGARGAAGVIPPNATLMFEVELLELK